MKGLPTWLKRTITLFAFTGSVVGSYAAAGSKLDGRVDEKVTARMLIVETHLSDIEKRLDRLEGKIDRLVEMRYK